MELEIRSLLNVRRTLFCAIQRILHALANSLVHLFDDRCHKVFGGTVKEFGVLVRLDLEGNIKPSSSFLDDVPPELAGQGRRAARLIKREDVVCSKVGDNRPYVTRERRAQQRTKSMRRTSGGRARPVDEQRRNPRQNAQHSRNKSGRLLSVQSRSPPGRAGATAPSPPTPAGSSKPMPKQVATSSIPLTAISSGSPKRSLASYLRGGGTSLCWRRSSRNAPTPKIAFSLTATAARLWPPDRASGPGR